mgnify:CR=1 FL=1
MQKLSNSSFLNLLSKFLLLLVVAKSISLVFLWILPDEGVEIKSDKNFQPSYHRIDFSLMLQRVSEQKKVQTKQNVQAVSVTLTNMILKGLYGEREQGFAILALKSSPSKTEIISVGEVYSGYTLKMILKDAVIFVKNAKEYTLTMQKDKTIASSYVTPMLAEETVRAVSTSDIQYYAKNPDAIWKEISINQLPQGKGFEITRVQAGSKMAALGLQKGDIMIRANNRELVSYKDAIDLYQQVGTLQAVQIVILRNNEEKEFVYEIN